MAGRQLAHGLPLRKTDPASVESIRQKISLGY
jgi:hypothetical protein